MAEGNNGTILIVDDTPTNLEVLQGMLSDAGYELLNAIDGESAIKQATYASPDLILLDVMMPGIDGFETCRRLKNNEDTHEIPVIFMTALSDPSDKIRGFEQGGVDYVTKPLHHGEVLARVNTHISLRRLQRELQAANTQLETRVAERTFELAQSNKELSRRLDELAAIDELVGLQNGPPAETEQAYAEILRIIGKALGTEEIVLYRPDKEGQTLMVTASYGGDRRPARELAAKDNSAVAIAFADRKPVVRDGEGSVPLIYQEEVLGVLQVGGVDPADGASVDLSQTLQRLGREAALVLCVMQLAADLEGSEAEVSDLLSLQDVEDGDQLEIPEEKIGR